ncbi:MAG: DUF1501 domain-containing protein [Desulfobacteraceae bacterium]|nr:MAG: DUF1501 domain-containing protein [Desulfobacteraceae bacterium]
MFNPSVYAANQPQTIMIFLYGGASELGGNFTNYNQFKNLSQSSYEAHFRSGNLVATPNGFWERAGGTTMESLLSAGDLSVFRTCFSQVRWDNGNRSHGSCVAQNQRGSFNEDAAGIFANLGRILKQNHIINTNTRLPFLTMEGESGFFAGGDFARDPLVEPISMSENVGDNPFRRYSERDYSDEMDALAQHYNPEGQIKDAFEQRMEMEEFINTIDDLPDPELGTNNYENNSFARKLKTAIKVMDYNPDTRVISLGTSGLGGWDDHNDAEEYMDRMEGLFLALKSGMAHIRSLGKRGKINIIVMGEFGRGVNLNSANGWDHGNLQTVFVLGGTDYFSTPGIVGETVVENTGSVNRLFLRPKSASYWFEPLSVASTIYSIYGVTNPQVLTDGNPVISPLV